MAQPQYATIEQLVALSLTPASAAKFTTDAMTANLQAASSRADLYLSSQLELPLSQWDMILTKAVCDIAAKELFSQFGYNPAAGGDANMQRRFMEAVEWLKQVSKQELRLDSNPNYVDSSSGSPKAGPMAISNSPVGFGFTAGTNNDPSNGWNG